MMAETCSSAGQQDFCRSFSLNCLSIINHHDILNGEENWRLTTINNPTIIEDDCINRIIHFTLKNKKKV